MIYIANMEKFSGMTSAQKDAVAEALCDAYNEGYNDGYDAGIAPSEDDTYRISNKI